MDNKQAADEAALLETKAGELIVLLQKGIADKDRLKAIRERVYEAFDEGGPVSKEDTGVRWPVAVDNKVNVLNDFEFLVSHHQMDSDTKKAYFFQERLKKGLIVIISIIMITLGLAMIIMPAPPYFEMFTIFYFNKNDGVTIMDLISLIVIFTGIYLLLSTVLKKVAP